MNKILKKLLVLGLASTVALASVGGIACKDNGDSGNSGVPTVPNTSTVEKSDPQISIASSLSLVLGESKSAGVVTKNITGDIVYSVNNEGKNVVSFEAGMVKAIGAGSAVITASFGSVSASCPVTVTYGNYVPSLEMASNLTENVYLALGSNNSIAPYIDYNGIVFEDGIFTFESDNEEAVSVSNSGVITANQVTDEPVKVTVKANWRDFSSDEYSTLSKSFDVQVRNNVSFLINGEIPANLSVDTPASFQKAAEHNNVIKVEPSVVVNGVEEDLASYNISVTGIGDTKMGNHFLWDVNKHNFAAFKKGSALVELSYRLDGDVFTENFEIEITRPVKVLTDTINYFSSRSGLFKVDNGDGTYTDTALEMVAWGKDVTLVDAYSEGVKLNVNNSNGAVTGLAVNQDSEINTTITLGTDTDLIEVPVSAAAYYISNAQDFKNAFEQIGLYEEIKGYHKLLCDIDMTGVIIDNRIDSNDDFGASRFAGYRLIDGAYIDSTSKKKIGFNGVFDGDGYTVSNAVSVMQNYKSAVYEKDPTDPANEGNNKFIMYGNNRGYGLFHNVLADGVIKNVAFDNLTGLKVEGNQNELYGLTAPLSFNFSGTLQNVFINVGEDNATTRGAIANIGGSATLSNVVVEFERPEGWDFASQIGEFTNNDLYAYGFGSLSSGAPSTSAKMNGVYVISKVPIAFDTTRGFISSDTSAQNAITYAENETELIYEFSAFDIVHGNVNHTVKSTVGDHNVNGDGVVTVTGKTKIFKGVQRYNNYQELANCTYEKTAERSELFASSSYWAMAGNVPIWHSMLDKHENNYSATIGGKNELAIDLYDSQPVDVTLYGVPASNVKFTENSDLIEIDENNVIKGIKIGTGAEVSAEFYFGGKKQSINFTVDVLYPFYLTNNGEVFDGYTFAPEGEEFNINVYATGNLVSNVKFTSDSTSLLSINGSTFKGNGYKDGIVVTAEFTYNGDKYTKQFILDILDIVAENAVLTIGGTTVENEEISLVIDDAPATVVLTSDAGSVGGLIVASSNDNFIVEDNKLQANLYGQSEITLTFTLGGQVHVKKITANAIHSNKAVEITSKVEYDAYEGKLITSELDESGIVEATVTFGKEISTLTRENGGITEDGKIRVKTSNGDTVPGAPIINSTVAIQEDAKVVMVVKTYKKVYNLTAQYYTSVIESVAELKAALDVDYNVVVNNSGYYKLGNDISIDPANPLTYDYVGAKNSIKDIDSNVGFIGNFDGSGYSINFNNTGVGAYGIFGNFNHSGGLTVKQPIEVKNLAVLNYKNEYSSIYYLYSPVFAKHVKDHSYSGDVYFNDIYVSYGPDAQPNGLFQATGKYTVMNNVVIDSSKVTVKPAILDETYGNGAGLISPLSGFKGGTLFTKLRYGAPMMSDKITNVVAIGTLPLVKNNNYTLSSDVFIHTTNPDGTYTHTLKGTGFTYSISTDPIITNNVAYEPYYALPGNKQDIAIIQGLKPEVLALATKNRGTALKIKACLECLGTFLTGRGTTCTVEGCGATLTTINDAWVDPMMYNWTFDVATYENPASTNLNGVMVFKGISKYDDLTEMSTSGNSFESFKANSFWKVADGTLTWVGAQAN